MKCTSCGQENIEGAENCTNCEQSFKSAPVAAPPPAPPSVPSAYAVPTAPGSAPLSASQQQSAPVATPYNTAPPSQPAATPYTQAPSYNAPPARPVQQSYQQAYQQPYQQVYPPYYYPPVQRQKRPFTITDAYIIIGFVLAIVGIFYYAYILLPASIGFSVVGFVKRNNARTLGLSLAGIVVGVVACLIKVGMVLSELGVIPDWLSAGIF